MSMQDVVLLSTADWDNPFWTNKQHVAVDLAARGHRVLYIDSLGLRRPSASGQDLQRILRRLRKGVRPPREVRPKLWVWSPVLLPLHGVAAVRRLNRTWLTTALRFWCRRLGLQQPVLWTYNPLTTELIAVDSYAALIYHCVDEIKAQPGMPVAALEAAERILVAKAKVVFTTSPRLYETRKVWNRNTFYFPNVADSTHFGKALSELTEVPADLLAIPAPRLGFIGAISGYKVDFDLLAQVAQRRPDWSLVLIGKVGEGEPWTNIQVLHGLPNVYLLGPRPYESLPNYLRGFDVALLPSMLNEYTASMFPMKFFEYLAAGKPVVSTRLAALGEFEDACALADTPAAFVDAVSSALAGACVPLARRLELAGQHTYASRMDKMLRCFDQCMTVDDELKVPSVAVANG